MTRTKSDPDMDKRIYELELKFKMFDQYDKIYNENNFELKNTLEIENKINELNKKTKHTIILDKTFCLVCHQKKNKHIDQKFCYSQNFKDVYKPFKKNLIEVKV